MKPGERARAQAHERVREAGGDALLERLLFLDDRARERPPTLAPPPAPAGPGPTDFDVALAGGGLSLLLAPVLADLGLRVGVFDRARAGMVHREWNASGPELAPLWESGIFSPEEVEGLVLARYREGVCRWHGGGTHAVRGVLDHAVDAGRLLSEVRKRAEARGVVFHDECSVLGHAAGSDRVAFEVQGKSGPRETLTARVLVDARGIASPHNGADLLCPTVGGVLEGLTPGSAPDEMDPEVGDILATTEDVEAGRQHIWEAFPGRPGQTTVYLFYYARADQVAPGSLVELYDRFFQQLPTYKRGDARLVRPTFGHIPGWTRLRPQPASGSLRVVPFGDAAARHSPLTYCGFGHLLRTFVPAARAIAARVEGDDIGDPAGDAPIHALTGALADLMANPPPGASLNQLLDAAFGTLHEMGNAPFGQLLRDEMGARDFIRFLRVTAGKHPAVYTEVLRRLGLSSTARWGLNLLRARRVAGAGLDAAGVSAPMGH